MYMIRLYVIAVLACAMMLSAMPVTNAASSEATAQLTPFPRIRILSDDDFTADNGVSSGSGTSGDPYIIENLEIDGNGSMTCIWMVSTTKFVVIRDVVVNNGSFGIKLQEVENVRVDSCTMTNHTVGIRVAYSDKSAVVGNTISGCDYGIFIVYSEGVRFDDNTLFDNEVNIEEEKLSWELGRTGTYICTALAIPLAIALGLLIWMRFRHPREGDIKPPVE
ncbi:MAG TPA: right-handed parallel beta-helix repeat-containing protein [Thermoplasmata archaeon]|nr:right-handed parallel beta-helix repeat-containing protein [Thermoplasmata archaeon]